MKSFVSDKLVAIAWTLSALVTALSVVAWGELRNWSFDNLNEYALFPVLGLLAFSLMWAHYIVYALRVYSGSSADTKKYKTWTGYIVLFAIIAHPGLVIYRLNSDGLGVPPESYEAYVGEALVGFIYIATIAWFAFISYEFKKWLQNKTVWTFVSAANVIAMLFILAHALKLGQHLQGGWYQSVFYFYGVSLIASFVYLAKKDKLI